MLKIGILGAGHLGKIHLKLLDQIPEFVVVGFYDPDDKNAAEAEAQFGVERYFILSELLNEVDAIDIVTPTVSHFECAKKALKQFRHIFIEKPLTNTLAEARQLVSLVEEAGVKAQVGHVERFNPAFLAVSHIPLNPMFIESHRLAVYNPRGTDVSVVLDLMIHDIDIVLSMVNANVRRVSANGVAVISDRPDIANARIEFDNGCVANLTASRMSMKNMRKMRLFQHENYISIDFAEKKTEIFTLGNAKDDSHPFSIEIETGNGLENKRINYKEPVIKPVNSIKMELELFASSILNDQDPPVTILDGFRSMELAHKILEKIHVNSMI